jgi:SAM-dependent methyltransferase
MAMNEPQMPDFWTKSREYRQAYQKDEQIETVLGLLQLAGATGLIDLGCGNGAFAVEAAKRHPGCRVWACDVLPGAVDECRRRAEQSQAANVEAIVASAESVPLPDGCADRLLMRNALHHVGAPESAFDEFARLLCRGGRLVLEGPVNAWDEEAGSLLTKIHELMDSSHRRVYLRPQFIVASLARRGFVTKAVDLWPYPFRVDDRQMMLIREHGAEHLFQPTQREGGWSVQFKATRIVAVLEQEQQP